MRAVIALILCLCALPANAQSLQGQWDTKVVSRDHVFGALLIDAERRATWDISGDGKTSSLIGYVKRADNGTAEILLSNREAVYHLRCAVHSIDLLHCYVHLPNDGWRVDLIVTRVGPGPQNLMLVHR